MLYLMSDIHGDLKSFKGLLKNIDFNIDILVILADVLGKETIDTYNTSDTRGTSLSYGMNYQKLMGILITIILYSRMISIYLHCAVAPLPLAKAVTPDSTQSNELIKENQVLYSAVLEWRNTDPCVLCEKDGREIPRTL